ncbi:MAG: hypothetical protein QW733_01690 [Desulfurococcaceae archaeon]
MLSGNLSNEDVEEYYFDDYYRVVVVRDEQDHIVSVDVYRPTWKYDSYESICVENVCLLISVLRNPEISAIHGVKKIIVIGVKVNEKVETVNVKWIVDHKPSRSEVEAMYRESWRLV